MIKYETIPKYEFKSPFGKVTVDKVRMGVSDRNGARYLPGDEVERCTLIAIRHFYSETYFKVIRSDFEFSRSQLKALMSWMGLTQESFGKSIGYQKSKMSKALDPNKDTRQGLSPTAKMLLIERIGMELNAPGMVKIMVDGDESEFKSHRLKAS